MFHYIRFLSLVYRISFCTISKSLCPNMSIGEGGDITGLITEKVGDVWQVEEIQITSENRVV